jgi:uncharacterized membrane protein
MAGARRAHHASSPVGVEQQPATGRLERLIFLSDGVFAIAMTLLVVELTLPEVTSGSSADLGPRLLALSPKYLSYAVSFLVIASYWASHQRVFSHVVRADDRLVVLNVLLLLCIAFQPFPTSVLGIYGDQPLAVMFYAATLAVTGGIVLAMWIYATAGRRLVAKDLSPRLIQSQTWRALTIPAVFLISIPIALANPTLAKYFWLTTALVIGVLRRVYRDAT